MSGAVLVRIGISHRKEIRRIVVAAAGFGAGELRLHRRNQTASVRSPRDEDGKARALNGDARHDGTALYYHCC